MIGELTPQKLLYRDGVSQSQRLMGELDPAYINIEDRSLADFLAFAKGFAKYLRFYDEKNSSSTNWVAFLSGGFEKKSDQEIWLAGLLNYVDDPDGFAALQPEKAKSYGSPHLALFIVFLKLLEPIKTQLSQFTKKHLDLYYFELLGLNRNKPVPDVVDIIVELSNDVDQFLLEKGTSVIAGKDSLGKDLVYKVQKDTLITKAAIAKIRSVFIGKKFVPLKDKWNEKDVLLSIKKMLNMALGYDTFDPDIFLQADKKTIDNEVVSREALKYQLKDIELRGIVEFVLDNAGKTSIDDIVTWLNIAYRRQQLKATRKELGDNTTVFKLIETVLAAPDGHLPKFSSSDVNYAEFLEIKKSLQKSGSGEKLEASLYVREKLLLSVDDFIRLANYTEQTDVREADWAIVYAILEVTLEKKGITPEVPPDTEWLNLLASDDVKANIAEGRFGRFRTFGENNLLAAPNITHPALGLAISSPGLSLSEGNRKIDLSVSFKPVNRLKAGQLKQALDDKKRSDPFRFFIGAADDWSEVTGDNLQFGDFIHPEKGIELTGVALDKDKVTAQSDIFSKDDKGDFIIWIDGSVYRIAAFYDKKNIEVTLAGKIQGQKETKKYKPADVNLDTLRVQLNIDTQKPLAIADKTIEEKLLNLKFADPAIVILLADDTRTASVDADERFKKRYGLFNNIFIEKVKADITVTGIKSLALQNDFAELDPKRPFEPFGPAPQAGDSLYFWHPEIACKAINSLALKFEWVNPPADFKAYYEGYKTVCKEEINGSNKLIIGNDYFKAKLEVITNDTPVRLGEINLFVKNEPVAVPDNCSDIPADKQNSQEAVIDHKRYFGLELLNDFNHAAYPTLQTIQALAYEDPDKRKAILNVPYTPKVKQVTAGYTSSVEIFTGTENNSGCLYSLNTFGYSKYTPAAEGVRFIPALDYAGELYLGLVQLDRQQNLSLLFQFAGGTADPELAKPAVSWSFLKNNKWVDLPQSSIVADTTKGLVNTGIVELDLPAGITNQNMLLGEGLYWLRATINEHNTAIPDAIDIIAQGASAVFVDQDNAQDHLVDLLGPGSVKGLADITPAVKKLEQPFVSMYGRPGETDKQFYTRVSERLRHKNRGLALWDYERLVLQQFTEIYKVKCMPATYSSRSVDTGMVDIIVVPNIKGRYVFDQFQPKVPANLLLSITEYLEDRIPPFATVKVRNAVYVVLKVKTAVRIKKGFSEEFHLIQLENELKKFLSPWAYDDDADIIIGGRMYKNVVVNFMAKRPYIDHVATIRLSQSVNGGPFIDVPDTDDGSKGMHESPDVILVSASRHEIKLLKDDGFSPNSMVGIGYMEVANDFIIRSDLIIYN